MQQTENLKLNLIETGDPLSPAPINENAEKIEAKLVQLDDAIAATDGRHCIDKLLGPLIVAEGEKELIIDLSGIDVTRYGALVLVYSIQNAGNTTDFTINGTGVMPLLVNGSGVGSCSGGGMAALVPAGARVFAMSISSGLTSSAAGGVRTGSTVMAWAEMNLFRLYPIGEFSSVSVYGIRP